MTNGEVLNSWKEIATYLGRGVRTVQRWERDLDLPVRRPRGKQRSAVIAIKGDLDLWLRIPHGAQAQINRNAVNQKNRQRLLENAHLLQSRTLVLVARSNVLKKQIAQAISIGMALRQACNAGRGQRKVLAATSQAIRYEIKQSLELGAALLSSGGGGEESPESRNLQVDP